MASTSAHFNLTKPATTDYYNIGVFNDNTDIIDTQMYNNQVSAAKIMVGATANDDGESGRVPVPHAGDQDKYLCADGTWKTVSGGGGGGTAAAEMTLEQYDALTTQQKNDGTIRFIPASNVGQSQAVDMSNITKATDFQNAMSATATSSTKTTITWNGGSNIGAMYYYTSAVDVTNWDKIVFDIKTGLCYDGTVSSAMYDRWYLQFGVMTTAPTTLASLGLITADDPLWLACKGFAIVNTTSLNQEIDVSNITGNVYIVVVADGWNATVENIKLATEGNVSQIKYMSKTYADGTGGGSGGGIDYSTSEQDTGLKWIDGSEIYQQTINIVNSSSVSATRDVDLSSYVPSGARVIEFSGIYEYVYSSKNYGMAIGSNSVYGYMWDNAYRLKLDFGSGSFDSDEINLTIKYTKASS